VLTSGTGTFCTWAPRLYEYYLTHLTRLYDSMPGFSRCNFTNSIWPAASFNLGPRTITYAHRDSANLAFGWCAVTAFGNFNPKFGGHLILWDMEMVIEFPPGATILIPSATLRHSNTALRPGELQKSFTQYCAGGLIRWEEQGCRTAAAFKAADKRGKAAFDRESAGRWEKGVGLFSTIEELTGRKL
jgi:hypothetical protein